LEYKNFSKNIVGKLSPFFPKTFFWLKNSPKIFSVIFILQKKSSLQNLPMDKVFALEKLSSKGASYFYDSKSDHPDEVYFPSRFSPLIRSPILPRFSLALS